MCLQIAGKEQEERWGGAGCLERALCFWHVVFLIGTGHSLAWGWCLEFFQVGPRDRTSLYVLPQTCREAPTLLLGMAWKSIPNPG